MAVQPTDRDHHMLQISRGDSGGDTPGHIPNPEVKPSSADGTAGATRWESRSPREPFTIEAAPFTGAASISLPGSRRQGQHRRPVCDAREVDGVRRSRGRRCATLARSTVWSAVEAYRSVWLGGA